ncbi:MAG: FlgT C-terminal domain-containing protein [candidate division KSB1 bacterium]
METRTVKKNNKPLVGKVSGILTERELAINIGLNQGLKPGMRFKVLADQSTEIRDPETGDILGSVDREKIRLKVSEVHEKFSICRAYSKSNIGLLAMADIFEESQNIPGALEADNSALLLPLSKEESYVKKGDRVVQIFGDED